MPSPNTSPPPTIRQLDYIRSLARDRNIPGDAKQVIRTLLILSDPLNPTKSDASRAIEILIKRPATNNQKALAALDTLDEINPEQSPAINLYPQPTQSYTSTQTQTPITIPTPIPIPPIPDSLNLQLLAPIIESALSSRLHSIQNAEKQIVKAAGDFAERIAQQATRDTLFSEFNREKLDPLIKSSVEKCLKGAAESLILSLLPKSERGSEASENQYNLFPQTETENPAPQPLNTDNFSDNFSDFYFDPLPTRALLTALKLRKNFYISGPSGCGKTQLILKIHEKLNKEIYRVNMRGDVTSNTFLGGWRIRSGETTYSYGALPLAMKTGATLLCDEIDYTPPHIAAILNPVMEGARTLYLDDTQETMTAQKGFLIAVTGNSGGKGDATGVYTGIEVLNTAFLDRFAIKINMGYLPPHNEVELLRSKFPHIPPETPNSLVGFATHIRDAFQRQELSATLSTRKLIDLLEILSDNFTLKEALNFTFLNWLDDDDKRLATTFIDRLDFGNEE